MNQRLFERLKIGMPVSYMNLGTRKHDFFYVIVKINKESQTVDIERYSSRTGEPDEDRKIYQEQVSLAEIEFLNAIDRLIGLDHNQLKVSE